MSRSRIWLSHDYILEANQLACWCHQRTDSFRSGKQAGPIRKPRRAAGSMAGAKPVYGKRRGLPFRKLKAGGPERPVARSIVRGSVRLNLRVGVAGHNYVLYDYIG